MLTYFPTPYPNELWYSILCRYYVRSGSAKQLTIANELYGGRFVGHGSLFPGSSCAIVLGWLPAGLFSVEDILLKHTLMPYYLRMQSAETKRMYLQAVSAGRNISPKNTDPECLDGRQGLKYCPECFMEDQARFGEPYWHREHQIPLMPLCPVHRCRLVLVEHSWRDINRKFYPASELMDIERPNTQAAPWEETLTELLRDFLELPFEAGPVAGYSNLSDVLITSGYSAKSYHGRLSVNGQKLHKGCMERFNQQVIAKYFSKPYPSISHRIQSWMFSAPEIYALLSVLAGISAAELFGPRMCDDSVRMAERRTETIGVLLTASEWRAVEAAAARSGHPVSVFVRERLLSAIEYGRDI